MKMDGYQGEFLSEDDIIRIHDRLAEESEADETLGFIDETGYLFRSAVNSIYAGFGGQDIYPSVAEKACRLCYNIVTTHCFRNVNKRTGVMAMLMTLQMNGIKINLSEDELFDAVTMIASSTNKNSWENFRNIIMSGIVKAK